MTISLLSEGRFPSQTPKNPMTLTFADGKPLPDDETAYILAPVLALRYGPESHGRMAALMTELREVVRKARITSAT